jgi:site-specific DNA-methyltransferase (adenine-specific)
MGGSKAVGKTNLGRWPANLCHDGCDEVLALFPQSKSTGGMKPGFSKKEGWNRPSHQNWKPSASQGGFGDDGSAARFMYCAKANKHDRAGSKHPTVKPQALMRWLVSLVTPPGGTVLDPFGGSGSTGQAALAVGRKPILIEREEQWFADCVRRIEAANDNSEAA